MNKIPAKERTSVLLFYMQGYSVKEIAEIQENLSGCSETTYLSRVAAFICAACCPPD